MVQPYSYGSTSRASRGSKSSQPVRARPGIAVSSGAMPSPCSLGHFSSASSTAEAHRDNVSYRADVFSPPSRSVPSGFPDSAEKLDEFLQNEQQEVFSHLYALQQYLAAAESAGHTAADTTAPRRRPGTELDERRRPSSARPNRRYTPHRTTSSVRGGGP